MPTAEELIDFLRLQPHPREGGWYRETHRSALQLPAAALATRYHAARSAGTAIYYLLTPQTCSALHRLPTDEVFHFYLGDPVEMLQLGAAKGNRKRGQCKLEGKAPQRINTYSFSAASHLLLAQQDDQPSHLHLIDPCATLPTRTDRPANGEPVGTNRQQGTDLLRCQRSR